LSAKAQTTVAGGNEKRKNSPFLGVLCLLPTASLVLAADAGRPKQRSFCIMKHRIFYVSEDGLLKTMMNKHEKYMPLFSYEYNSIEEAETAIKQAVADEQIPSNFYTVEFVILPVVNVKP
jgi:hypothetical protein